MTAAIKNADAAGLAVNLQCWDRLDLADELAKRFTDVQFVIDHTGLNQPMAPPVPKDVPDDLPRVLALARYPNLAMKVTGACTYVGHRTPTMIWGSQLAVDRRLRRRSLHVGNRLESYDEASSL